MKTLIKLAAVIIVPLLFIAFQDGNKKKKGQDFKFVYFEKDSDEILTKGPDKSIADSVINKAARKVLSCNCMIRLNTSADFDERMSPGYGIQESRGFVVKKLLMSKGVPESKIMTTFFPAAKINFIKSQAVIDAATTDRKKDSLRSFNRNVEVKVLEIK